MNAYGIHMLCAWGRGGWGRAVLIYTPVFGGCVEKTRMGRASSRLSCAPLVPALVLFSSTERER